LENRGEVRRETRRTTIGTVALAKHSDTAQSNPVKLGQTDAFWQNAGNSYAATLPSTTYNSNAGPRRFDLFRPSSTWFDLVRLKNKS
jgi:hypothetical protein